MPEWHHSVVQGWIEGALTVAGIKVLGSRVAELATRVGVVFQDVEMGSSHKPVCSHDEVMFGPENLLLPVPEVQARADEALAFVGAGSLAERFVGLWADPSRRWSSPRCWRCSPRICYFDEPTANLDPSSSSDVFASWLSSNSASTRSSSPKTRWMS